jgi:hypothetical protein
LGAVVLTALPEALRFANEYRLIVYGLIIVAVMLWRTDGLLGRTPLGVARRISGITLRSARLPQSMLRAEDVLSPSTAAAKQTATTKSR